MTDPHETQLTGGHANAGAVSRVVGDRFGDSVRRPAKPQTETVHAFLVHLRDCGIEVVAKPLGFDDDGREVLSFIEGQVQKQTIAGWDFPASDPDHKTLVAVASAQKRMHDAAATFAPPADVVWGQAGDYFPPGAEGSLPCHNDLCISNVLFDDDGISGIIDFDYLHPVNRLFDIAVAIRHWLPVTAPEDAPTIAAEFGRRARFHAYCDVHELRDDERATVIELIHRFLSRARSNVARLAAGGAIGFQQMIADGYDDRVARTLVWIEQSRAELLCRHG